MELKGKRVNIRCFTEQDKDIFLASVEKSKEVLAPWVSAPNTPEKYGDFLSAAAKENQASFLVGLNDSEELVGVFNINNIVRGCFQSAFLGYYGFIPYHGKGLMNEGLTLIIDYAFFHIGLHRIEANIQPENKDSIQLVKRRGFVEEGYSKKYLKIAGYWRDHIKFALTLEQAQQFWMAQANKKTEPWLPDFEFTSVELKNFLISQDSKFKAMSPPTLLDHGWDNDVYLINNDLIFRCPRRHIAATLIQRENNALLFLKGKLNVNIPDPIYKFIGPTFYPYPFHGYRMLPGEPLHKLALSEQSRSNAIHDFAVFLKSLHNIPEEDFLEANVGLQVFDRTKSRYIQQQIIDRAKKFSKSLLTVEQLKIIEQACEEAINIKLDPNKNCLIHGDLYCKHLLFKDDKLISIIDWGDVGINHPVIDLAALYAIFPIASHSNFYKTYGEVSSDIKRYAKFLAIHSSLACLDFAIANKDDYLLFESKRTIKVLTKEDPDDR